MIKTKASIVKEKEAESEFKVIKFEGLKRLPKTKPPTQKEKKLNSEDEEFEAIFGDGPKKQKPKKDKSAVTFDRARREVMNFGISGSNASDKNDHIQQLLIKLGARPPKNKERNYKEILEEKKKQKDEDDKVNKRTLFGTSASLQYRSQKKKSRNDDLLKSYGKLDKDSLRQIKNKNIVKKKR
ncbi:hypothetical protein PVAND_002007 [Polypedilum vanderplanki]|uniref:Uncharacterized protein n=1 Tax=Polypedilum vanderplanki TaxID=319348 RepID=A0A9J6BPN4_POLVA|nr:hypothetical protein PVAND_002007 [Polypedilum vanderplanki]